MNALYDEAKETLVQYWQRELSPLGKVLVVAYAAFCLVELFIAIWFISALLKFQ